jgi:acetyl-CoA carboxylase biotin carboxyl carrier protein
LADDVSQNSRGGRPGSVDVRTIEALVALMTQHGLSEIVVRDGEMRICLRRGGAPGAQVIYPSAPAALPAPIAAPVAPAAQQAQPAEPARKYHEIRSPAVGTFYAQEKPGAPPYVSVGSRVSPSTVVCQIEAMKLFNEITADCSGVIVEVCVKNKEPVEFNTVLFRVDTSA